MYIGARCNHSGTLPSGGSTFQTARDPLSHIIATCMTTGGGHLLGDKISSKACELPSRKPAHHAVEETTSAFGSPTISPCVATNATETRASAPAGTKADRAAAATAPNAVKAPNTLAFIGLRTYGHGERTARNAVHRRISAESTKVWY